MMNRFGVLDNKKIDITQSEKQREKRLKWWKRVSDHKKLPKVLNGENKEGLNAESEFQKEKSEIQKKIFE